jgi:hypothetical protein
MDLSIVIVNWHSAAFVRNCLTSIYENERNLECEILVIDNASFDGCREIVCREFHEAKFIASTKNLGFAKANNLGASHSTGRNLLFLNPDTEVLGSALKAMVTLLDSRPEVGIVGCKLLNTDRSVQTSCVQSFPTIWNQALDTEYLRTMFPNAALWGTAPLWKDDSSPSPVDAVSGACLMIRRSVFEQVGGFSPNYFMYAEDADLCYNVKQAGWKTYYVSAAEVIHHGGRSSTTQGESQFTAVMMRESLREFMRLRRGRLHAAAYRLTMGLVAVLRLAVLGVLFVLTIGRCQPDRARHALRKWAKVLRWVIGLEGWARQKT